MEVYNNRIRYDVADKMADMCLHAPRVVHLGDTANVPSIMRRHSPGGMPVFDIVSRYRAPYGYNSKWHDVKCTKFPIPYEPLDKMWWYARARRAMQKCDIIHIHAYNWHARLIRMLPKNKPVVLHCHGSQDAMTAAKRAPLERRADIVLVSTPNQLHHEYAGGHRPVYLPTPIDGITFARRTDIPQNGRGLIRMRPRQTVQETRDHIETLDGTPDIEWDIVRYDTHKTKPQMVEWLKRYEWYGNISVNHPLPGCGGYTGLLTVHDNMVPMEAASLGLKVLDSDGSVTTAVPPEHDPVDVVYRLHEIYKSLLR